MPASRERLQTTHSRRPRSRRMRCSLCWWRRSGSSPDAIFCDALVLLASTPRRASTRRQPRPTRDKARPTTAIDVPPSRPVQLPQGASPPGTTHVAQPRASPDRTVTPSSVPPCASHVEPLHGAPSAPAQPDNARPRPLSPTLVGPHPIQLPKRSVAPWAWARHKCADAGAYRRSVAAPAATSSASCRGRRSSVLSLPPGLLRDAQAIEVVGERERGGGHLRWAGRAGWDGKRGSTNPAIASRQKRLCRLARCVNQPTAALLGTCARSRVGRASQDGEQVTRKPWKAPRQRGCCAHGLADAGCPKGALCADVIESPPYCATVLRDVT